MLKSLRAKKRGDCEYKDINNLEEYAQIRL